jgi:hypothetical protein
MAEHNTLTDPELHEPKGISTALAGTVYEADGAGSGSWVNDTGLNTKTVNTIADFPAAVSGVITLDDNTNYHISANITTANRFVLGVNNAFYANNQFGPVVDYTGVGDMFTGVDKNFSLTQVGLKASSGTVFNLTDTTGGVVIVTINNIAIIQCAKLGNIGDLRALVVTNSAALDATQGFTFSGSNQQIISMIKFSMDSSNAAFIGVDLGASIAVNIEFDNVIIDAPAGAVGIVAAAASANLPVGAVGTLKNSTFVGGMTPTTNIDKSSIRWRLQDNSTNLPDTLRDALFTLNGNAVPTVTVVGTPILVAGVWNEEQASQFSTDINGRVTYLGESDLITPMSCAVSLDVASGTNRVVRVYLAKNGTEINNSSLPVTVDAGRPQAVTPVWQDTLVQNDYYELWVENETASVDTTVIDATFMLR